MASNDWLMACNDWLTASNDWLTLRLPRCPVVSASLLAQVIKPRMMQGNTLGLDALIYLAGAGVNLDQTM